MKSKLTALYVYVLLVSCRVRSTFRKYTARSLIELARLLSWFSRGLDYVSEWLENVGVDYLFGDVFGSERLSPQQIMEEKIEELSKRIDTAIEQQKNAFLPTFLSWIQTDYSVVNSELYAKIKALTVEYSQQKATTDYQITSLRVNSQDTGKRLEVITDAIKDLIDVTSELAARNDSTLPDLVLPPTPKKKTKKSKKKVAK